MHCLIRQCQKYCRGQRQSLEDAETGELLQSTWFFLTTQLPVPSCPLALEPHRKLWPPAVTAAECFLPAAIWGGDRLGWSAK